MEKLVELLNEYENRDEDQQIEWRIGEGDEGEKGKVRGVVNEVYMGWVSELVVCSAHYGFIKWLVENEKIDLEKMEEKSEYTFIKNGGGEHIIEDVLMLLSIQDNPIEFLVSILK